MSLRPRSRVRWKRTVDENERETKIRELFPMIRKIARRVARMVAGSDIDDLVGEGCVGLIRAVDSFDPTRGPSLEQYAGRIVAGAMLNGLRRLDPVSERVRREMREAERERYALANERGTMPSQREMEERRPALRRAATHALRYTPLSLDSPLPIGERLAKDLASDPAFLVGEIVGSEDLRAALQRLPPRLRDVIELHYFGELSLHQIGERMRISPQRASQLHLAALKKLQKVVHAPIAY